MELFCLFCSLNKVKIKFSKEIKFYSQFPSQAASCVPRAAVAVAAAAGTGAASAALVALVALVALAALAALGIPPGRQAVVAVAVPGIHCCTQAAAVVSRKHYCIRAAAAAVGVPSIRCCTKVAAVAVAAAESAAAAAKAAAEAAGTKASAAYTGPVVATEGLMLSSGTAVADAVAGWVVHRQEFGTMTARAAGKELEQLATWVAAVAVGMRAGHVADAAAGKALAQIGTWVFAAVPVAVGGSVGRMTEATASTVVSANKVATYTDEGLAVAVEVQCWARCNFLVAGEAAAVAAAVASLAAKAG